MHLVTINWFTTSPLLFTNCFAPFAGTISGVIGVAVTGFMLEHNGGSENPAGWQHSFATCAGLGITGSMLFILFAKGEKLFD